MFKNSLFIKIYLWFLLVTFLMLVIMINLDRITKPRPPDMLWRHTAGDLFSFYGQEAISVLDHEGLPALQNFVGRLERATGIRIFIFNMQGKEVAGRIGSIKIEQLAASVKKSSRSEFIPSPDLDLAARQIQGSDGINYVFAAELPHPPPPGPHMGETPFSFFIRLLVNLTVSALVCYLLARYLTAPIIKLGNATRQIAAGNFAIRVSPSLGNRKDEISNLALDFDLMTGRIESLLTSQRNLLRDISHELRSPLARLNVALELCRQHFGPEAQKPLDRIEREAMKVNELIDQILTLNRVESGTSELKKEKVDLAELIKKITIDANYEALSKKRKVTAAIEPCIVEGNPDLLHRAVENVVRNAVHYTVENSVVEVALRNNLDATNPHVLITVHDHGKGVPQEALSKLFTPFYRVDEGRDRQTGGVGLGLAITEAAVRRHGGAIEAENALDGGLIVKIILPVH